MLIPISETCQRRNRSPRKIDIQKFCDPSIKPTGFGACFRHNIHIFLQEHAEPEENEVDGNRAWCTVIGLASNRFLPFYIIEEKCAPFAVCGHCIYGGWREILICKSKYHVIIPMDGEWNNQLKGGVLDVRTHILHGMIHSNGYGHLICINGIEGGSKFISGRETMDLWDRFCRILRASKVSLKDVSKKRSMELRLLYAVAFGHTWFGRWGYEFCSGSLGVTAATYSHAVATLSGVLLEDALVSVGEANSHKVVADIIGHYKSLSKSKLTTVRDVLRFILYISCCRCDTFKRVQPSEYKKIESILLASKNWPAGRVTTCLNSMLNFLKAKTGEVERRG
ncbi:PHD finger protein MALE MEIOCYTE DEATH 1-like [Mercurialis annua]|uniref:PHD finger protein MALE MEIOCYTE DEATH 1-like n=1 Tax=Mercurialis annua TaxID=3986 RepID=UPI00215DEB2E|nr:PHD finger protein MALE MEIOCYTE DEATH 1-like [Mercurialis annua]